MMPPSVSIAILNYQRKDVLRQSLERALAQRCPGLEVLVVDNASTDGSAEMVQQEFPTVRLLPLPRNTGCAARNAGVAALGAGIVITLDNDVLLNSPDDAAKVLDFFVRHPTVASVNFKILDATGTLSRRDWCHPRDWRTSADRQFMTNYVLEGASAHRRDRFLEVGGYWAPLFIGHEGLDLGLRLLAAGHDLAYWPDVSVTHLASAEARPSSRIYYTFTRNGILVALRNHRPLQALLEIAKTVALMAFAAGRARHWGSFLSGVAAAVRDVPVALASRRPLRRDAYARLSEIRHLEPSVFAKAWRHWRERSL
jgi:GT2 family glycosyltransferase